MTIKTLMTLALMSIGLAASAQGGSTSPLISGVFESNQSGFMEFCKAARLPCGLLIDDNRPFGVSGPAIKISQARVSRVMDMFVERSTLYRWRDDAGTFIIEPKSLPYSVTVKLISTRLNLRIKETLSADACQEILDRVDVHSNLLTSGSAPIYAEVSTDIENLGVVAALNKVAREDGQMMWVLSFRKRWFHTDYSFITASWRREQPKRDGPP